MLKILVISELLFYNFDTLFSLANPESFRENGNGFQNKTNSFIAVDFKQLNKSTPLSLLYFAYSNHQYLKNTYPFEGFLDLLLFRPS